MRSSLPEPDLVILSCSFFWISSICSSSDSNAFFSCSIIATFFIRSSITWRERFSSASAFCCASIPSKRSDLEPMSMSSDASLELRSSISCAFSCSAFRSSTICSSASRRSSCSASLFSSMCFATIQSGMAAPPTIDSRFFFSSASAAISASFSDCSSLISCICSLITDFISACSFSIALAFGFTVIERHDWPKRRHAVDSVMCSVELDSARMMCSRLLPPRPLASIIVSFDSRNGMCFAPSARHLTTNASLVSDRLIRIPSLAAAPDAPVFFMPSEPARSTRLSCEKLLPFCSDHATCTISSACEREDTAFMLVAAVARILHPASYFFSPSFSDVIVSRTASLHW